MSKRERCWQCGRQLMYVKDKGQVHALVVDPIGHQHKGHKMCLAFALGDGIKEIKEESKS